jgi:chromosome segregation protein
MRLKTLRLHGFKSFADRTQVDFREGVTAIVGSNGCGKSNIADAIRWVLGEQRASAIRGARMDEVIFQGTARRRPLSFAEVSLLFSNEEGRIALPQTEIEVSRKVFREGGSEYSLNRAACRLRDIHGLLRDTGLGSNAYAIIEAGMIETLLSDRAEERRALFEEAAGVGRYKDSRQAAQRRLEAAQVDVARLDDLIAEVDSKVRSLARQKRRAQRHRDLRSRRLDLEVAVALHELEETARALQEGEQRRNELRNGESAAAAAAATSEQEEQVRRIEAVEIQDARVLASTRLEAVRQRLDAREKELLLAEERRAHAELRIQQLLGERSEHEQRLAHLRRESERLSADHTRAAEAVAGMRAQLEVRARENLGIRTALGEERAVVETAVSRARELARQGAIAEGERAAADRRRQEAGERLARLEQREMDLTAGLERALQEAEGGQSVVAEALAAVDALNREGERARADLATLRSAHDASRAAAREAEDLLSGLAGRVAARESLERGYEGFAPAVAALMTERERFPGVHGPLADFVPPEGRDGPSWRAIETVLGVYLQALVVRDLEIARDVCHWFREEWTGGGSLILLPLDAPAVGSGAGPAAVRGRGAGAPWVETLLSLRMEAPEDALAAYPEGVVYVVGDDVVDERGVVRLAAASAEAGILERRAALDRLRGERAAAEAAAGVAASARTATAAAVAEAEVHLSAVEERRNAAAVVLQAAERESSLLLQRHERLRLDREETERTLAAILEARREAETSLVAATSRIEALTGEGAEAGRAADDARVRLAELETAWEAARDREAEVRVAVARGEAETLELERRVGATRTGASSAAARLDAIERESAELRDSLEGLSGIRQQAGEEIERLFEERDRESAVVSGLEAQLAELQTAAAAAAERARAQRRVQHESAEEGHRLDLANAELRSRTERIRERLEAEWGRPWEALHAAAHLPGEGSPEIWMGEITDIARQIEQIGPVNMLAVEEHAEEERRLAFLLEQRADLLKARDDLMAAIRQINRTAREVFVETFTRVRENFQRTFHSLFQGGECDVWLSDPDDPLESPVEIHASPKGKKTQRIHLLSGGERTLTALALLFALYLVKPSPFCVLDEVDAPLDETNVGRFLHLLHDFKSDTQFIVITHNTRTMEAADWIYGVTMEDPGVSTLVGVQLEGAYTLPSAVG